MRFQLTAASIRRPTRQGGISMKKVVLILAALVVAAAAYASTAITVTPSSMKNGETKTLTDDGTTIKVTRDGDSMNIKIEGAGESRKITVTREGDGDIRINRGGDRERIIINGHDLVMPKLEQLPRMPRMRERSAGTLFVCPKDGASLRVPDDKKDETYKCPVDGTTMEKKKGHAFSFYFDDSDFGAFDSL
jgi:hypothetical protein